MNVVGGYVVTDRMLQMFRKKPVGAEAGGRRRGGRVVTTLEIDRDPRPDRLAGRARSGSSSAWPG